MNSGRSHFLSALLGALVVAVAFGALAIGGVFDSDDDDGDRPSAAAVPRPSDDGGDDGAQIDSGGVIATNVADLYEDIRTGVVSIIAAREASPLEERGGGPQPAPGGSGSGFVLDRQGFILTNDHVVEEADRIRVQFAEGSPVRARLVGNDPSSDLAVVKVDPGDLPEDVELKPLRLGSSRGLRVGEPVVALGSPFGLEGTLTTGVISALERNIVAPNDFPIDNVVQTDAAINPGNSGGPLLDIRGRVIGINAQIATSTRSNSGVGFAIPIDTAKEVLPELKRGEEIERPYLGVQTTDPPSGTGALVADVVDGGPAADAGLRARDRIVSIGGQKVEESSDVAAEILKSEPGDEVRIEVRRAGQTRPLTVRLGTRPDRVVR